MKKSIVMLAASAAFLVSGASALAQATPEPIVVGSWSSPVTPDPASCTATPASTDAVASLLATPVAETEIALTVNGLIALPGGVNAPDDVVAAVGAVLSNAWACNNARNLAAVLTFFTDAGIQSTYGSAQPTPFGFSDLRADVAARLTPGEPRTLEESASIEALLAVVTEADGSIGVLVLNSDPLVSEGQSVLDYFQLMAVDGVYKISKVVLDPFDVTPDYGFEA